MYDNVFLVFFSNRILLVLQTSTTSTTFSALSSCHDSAIWDSVRIPKQIIYGTNKTSLQEKINRFKTRSEILYSQGEEADNSNIFYLYVISRFTQQQILRQLDLSIFCIYCEIYFAVTIIGCIRITNVVYFNIR